MAFTPVPIPETPVPRWERRYRGRLRYELNALRSAGITAAPELDGAGRLTLTFDWPLDGQTTLHLKAVYPDAFPHIRPQVFLLGGLDPLPTRHMSPLDGGLCLLGRDSSQWLPSWTLHKLLTEQLQDAIRGTGDEDPQGEPADYWWNRAGVPDAYCLIDSAWDVGDAQQGILSLRYVFAGYGDCADWDAECMMPVPKIRAIVTEVHDSDGQLLHRWEGQLPHDAAGSYKSLMIPWVRLDKAILPSRPLLHQVEALRQAHPWLQQHTTVAKYGSNLSAMHFAAAHPIEIGFRETGLGWVLFQVSGQPTAFSPPPNTKHRKTLTVSTLPTYRAGEADIGHRVPAVKLLRHKRVLVVGTGAVGAPVAIELARIGCGTLYLMDDDLLEPGNMVRWPLGASAWGRRKVEALQLFLEREYPGITVHAKPHQLGQSYGEGDDEILDAILPNVDLVVDGSAAHGVTTLLADRCRRAGLPLISLFATPTLEGGAVVRHSGDGGCPNCLEHAWYRGDVEPPPGRGKEDGLIQPAGCGERTFAGAGYDLQELSLQAVRLAVETLQAAAVGDSLIQTLSFVDENNRRCPPRWRVDALPKHQACRCRP